MNFHDFASGRRNFVVAPAGHGKTYTIAKSLQKTTGRQLVLTHTHAGIASIKRALQKDKADIKRFSIQTITGFAQQYACAFCEPKVIPNQEDDDYFDRVVDLATDVLKLKLVRTIIASSYFGLFVDEYQDCSIRMHEMIMVLADDLPTHALGDHLQGIFGFRAKSDPRNKLVDLEKALTDNGFKKSPTLTVPHRWYTIGNKELGDRISLLRKSLEDPNRIDLRLLNENASNIIINIIGENESLYTQDSSYKRLLQTAVKENTKENDSSFLLLQPDGVPSQIKNRVNLKIKNPYLNGIQLLESIDPPDFYAIAGEATKLVQSTEEPDILLKNLRKTILERIFYKTTLGHWIRENGKAVSKKNPALVELSRGLKALLDNFSRKRNYTTLGDIVIYCRDNLGFKAARMELLSNIEKSFEEASIENISALEAMKRRRNRLRQSGRRTSGAFFGSTLLTKGLEFDTVTILDAHKFTCPKHFYVAASRACKRLIIFSKSPIIDFSSSTKIDAIPAKTSRKNMTKSGNNDGQYTLSLTD